MPLTRILSLPVLTGLSSLSLLLAGLVCTAPTATAGTGTFTQPAPVSVAFEVGGVDSASTDTSVTPDADGETSALTLSAPSNARTTDGFLTVAIDHDSMDDLDLVLVAPDGTAVTLLSDVGGNTSVDEIFTVSPTGSDGGPAPFLDDSVDVASGTPTDYDSTTGDADAFAGAAPADWAILGGAGVAGSWTLHAYDDTGASSGDVLGWNLTIYYGLTASPSPSTLTVSGMPPAVTDVNLVLHDVDAGYLADTEVVLESPDGRNAHVLSDVGGASATDLDLTLDDEAGADISVEVAPSTGTYRPRNYDDNDLTEPLGGVETIDLDARLSVFDGGPANGTWKLWVFQECCGADVRIGSWGLQITTADAPSPPAAAPADTTAPTVVKSTPKHRAKRIKTGAVVKVVFSEAMRASSLSKRTLKLATTSGEKVKVTLRYRAATHVVIVDPKKPLAPGTTYRLKVTTGARDLAGNALARAEKIRFRTR